VSARFYAAWALALVLAFVLPIAVPYALWAHIEGAHADPAAEFGRRAKVQIRAGGYVRFPMPLTASVEDTEASGGPPVYQAIVTARGPYGIPAGAYRVSDSGISRDEASENSAVAFAVLLAGVVAVSTPFVFVLLQRHFRAMRPASVV
jgi:hypothetical protein